MKSTKFCTQCGHPITRQIPQNDDHVRAVCSSCGHVHYENPKMVVGTIPVFQDRILMCKRNIDPRKGCWTLPAGYLENEESVQQGAVRETLEETRAQVQILSPYRMFNILFVDQIYMMFIAELLSQDFGPTTESTDVRLFSQSNIPWDEIAFDVIRQTLEDYFTDRKNAGDHEFNPEAFMFKIKDLEFSPFNGGVLCHKSF
ncbi:NUDIX hydrolase [Desulfobacter postgatei]|uniref:NUDIX hydrolase n=1 Tax=Desulfobacter postgatei TaxID=2293 RepID=UPI002A360656|nr:NUDIX hydrolase [Desulfobacter postgatei]MDX9963786.1 NUDIX hydrolase [Desulfobacter postgatei]